ncbi:hypothetical protein JCM14244_03350 [Venenivibrio stagnispumantis]|uniref:HAMP domain-containing protein n=1 Tax=Venenivibrio stagnispumantis TaxID=407998 RepID=A0AA46AEM5_9AQUI|nr:HAMP domain-containing protein [Venenivibrio stagnispumantis]MCW4572817.1 HAMP domain-containing protein [Venenivibrio stagnispumantis]SMP13613.1 HAMP domain-containing protein [Venenivibrio stagnispumantis]
MNKKSILDQIFFIVLGGSFIGAVLVGVLVFFLTNDLSKALISIVISQIFFILPVYMIRILMDRLIISKIKKVVNAMNEVSMGNLDTEVKIEGNDELSELAESFERMRISMKTIMEKLEKGEL